MGVNLLSRSESTFGDEALSVEQPSEANPQSSASDQWLWHPWLWHCKHPGGIFILIRIQGRNLL